VTTSSHRSLAIDGNHGTFSMKTTRGDEHPTTTLTAMEFLGGFVLRILPRGFVRIRQLRFLANIGIDG
jgi:hypothetical protein